MAGPLGYSIAAYSAMLADPVRTQAYCDALANVITPGCVVLEIGSGTGFFALWACRCGASKVYALEPSPAIEFARGLARHNCHDGHIDFIRDVSTAVSLEPRADVIVSDLRGVTPLFQRHLPSIIDARRRLLAPGGRVVPAADSLWAALLVDKSVFQQRMLSTASDFRGIDMTLSRPFVTDNPWPVRLRAHQVGQTARHWALLDYSSVDDSHVEGRVSWTLEPPTTVYGVAIWFDCCLCEGVGFRNAPARTAALYGQMVLPFRAPVHGADADSLTVHIAAHLVGEEYVWSWDTYPAAEGSTLERRFQQCTLWGRHWPGHDLRRRSASHVPKLSADGTIARRVLDGIATPMSVGAIAETLATELPDRFPHHSDALIVVGDLCAQFGR